MAANTEENPLILKEHQAIIEYNTETLDRVVQGKAGKPKLAKVLKRIYPYLFRLHDYAYGKLIEIREEHLPDEDRSGQFFVSCRYMERHYKGSFNTWNRNLNVFATLGLLEKVPANEREIITKDVNGIVQENPINIYVLPRYTDEQLDYAESIAYQLVENKFTLNAFSKIFLINVFGQDFADEIFHDDRKITAFSDYVTKQIERFILDDIEKNGYSTKQRVLNGTKIDLAHVKTNEYGFHNKSKRNILNREFQRRIADICNRNRLKYRPADKRLQLELNLTSNRWVIHSVKGNKKTVQ